MKILFSTGSLFFLPIEEVFPLLKEAGFDGCDLVIDGKFNNRVYCDHVRSCAEILPVTTIHAPYMKLPAWGDTVQALEKTVEFGKSIGAEAVNFHPPSWFTMEVQFLKWFRKVDDFQKALNCDGLVVTIENMPRSGKRLLLAPYVLNDYEDMIRFGIARNLYFTFDTTHAATFDIDVIVGFLKYYETGRLMNIHLSDFAGFDSHLFLGRGELPVAKFLNTLRRLGYDRNITLELAPHEWPKTREVLVKALRYSVEFLQLHLGYN